jgi:hypothetical protein
MILAFILIFIVELTIGLRYTDRRVGVFSDSSNPMTDWAEYEKKHS